MQFIPLNDNILIEPETSPETTESGLFLPPSKENRATGRGRILEIAPEAAKATNLKRRDLVLFPPYAGSEVKITLTAERGEETFLLMSYKSLFGTLTQ